MLLTDMLMQQTSNKVQRQPVMDVTSQRMLHLPAAMMWTNGLCINKAPLRGLTRTFAGQPRARPTHRLCGAS